MVKFNLTFMKFNPTYGIQKILKLRDLSIHSFVMLFYYQFDYTQEIF